MSLFQPDGTNAHIPTTAQAVYDVTGAGDTVISTLSLALASNVDKTTAATIANRAAGIAVGKLGTATVTCDELIENLQHDLHEL
jgi:D-beta-D-heptose 7-phosphate kinase/D-beta-D-heptose 1-phosphate adenosyltransferase